MKRPCHTRGERDRDRAVSEVMGFVLVFAIIIGSVGLLYATGFQTMEDYQEGERLHNAERAMDALADNFNDVVRYDAIEERSGELVLREGTLGTGDEGTTLEITIDDADDPWRDGNEISLGALEYRSGSDVIAYEGGGIFREDRNSGGSVTLTEPRVRCSPDVAFVSLVVIDADQRSLQSHGAQEITVSQYDDHSESVRYTEGLEAGEEVTIDVVGDGPRDQAWEAVLEEHGFADGCDADRVTVEIAVVDVDY